MLKVHAKISRCFRGLDMAEGYRKNGGYIVTSKKNGISAYNAMKTPFQWETPEFIKEKIASGE